MKLNIFLAFAMLPASLSAQNFSGSDGGSPQNQVAKATEFSIPSSPAFNLLNENTPSRIERFSSLHDFKVDWSLTNGQQGYTLSPGLALEAQPVWLLYFDRAGAQKYRRASPVLRSLSTLSLSIGTTASSEKNWLAYAAKITIYRQHDPLQDEKFLRALELSTQGEKDTLLLKIKALEMRQIRLDKRKPSYEAQVETLADSIQSLVFDIEEMERQQSQRLAEVRENYIQEHWNSSYLDVAFGKLMTYEQTTTTFTKTVESLTVPGELDTIMFSDNTLKISKEGYGVWLSGGLGLDKNTLLSGMVRFGKKPSAVTKTVGDAVSFGVNLRYGTRHYNFFIEAFFDRVSAPVLATASERFEQKFYMLTLGGDWRIGRNVVLCFGIRQTKDFDNDVFRLQPLVNVNCLMR